jgi:hypothetical protein
MDELLRIAPTDHDQGLIAYLTISALTFLYISLPSLRYTMRPAGASTLAVAFDVEGRRSR